MLPNIDPTKPTGPIASTADQRANWSAAVAWLNDHDIRLRTVEAATGVETGIYLPIAGGSMTGPLILAADPTVPLAAATMQFVQASVAARPSEAPTDGATYGRQGSSASWRLLSHNDITDWSATLAPYAPLASPLFTGTPAGPTPAIGDSSTRLATTAFVAAAAGNYNVKTYGAKGDGATNDTSNIQAAINAAAAAAAAAYFPPGVYRVQTLQYPTGLKGIVGAGREQSILRRIDNDTTTSYQINCTGVTGVVVRDLALDGNSANNTNNGAGMVMTNTGLMEFRNLLVSNQKAAGGVNSAYGWGIYINNSVDGANQTSSLITNTKIDNCDGNGIIFQNTINNLTVSSCQAENCGNGISNGWTTTTAPTGTQTNIQIIGCVARNNNQGGIGLGGMMVGFRADAVMQCVIANNLVVGNGSNGITLQGSYCTVSGNVVEGNGALWANQLPAGILLNGAHSVINGNIVRANQVFGMDAGGSVNCTISNNNIEDTYFAAGPGSGGGLNLGATVNVLVNGNNFIRNGSGYPSGSDGGSNIGFRLYDGGGMWPAIPFQAANLIIENNYFLIPAGSTAWGILGSGGVQGVIIRNNVFSGSYGNQFIMANSNSTTIYGNTDVGNPAGYSVGALASLSFADYADTVILTGASANISTLSTQSVAQNIGKVLCAPLTAAGSNYTTAPSVTITGDGTGATAVALLNGPAPAGVGAVNITNQGSGYTNATVSFSGGGGSGAAATTQIGATHVNDGRKFTIINQSAGVQTLVNGAGIKLAGGYGSLPLPVGNAITLLSNNGVFYEMTDSYLSLAGGTISGPITVNGAATFSQPVNLNNTVQIPIAGIGLTLGTNAGTSSIVSLVSASNAAGGGNGIKFSTDGNQRGFIGNLSAEFGAAWDYRMVVSCYDGLLMQTANATQLAIDGSGNSTFSGPVIVGTGTKNAVTVTPGAAAANAVTFLTSGAGGFAFNSATTTANNVTGSTAVAFGNNNTVAGNAAFVAGTNNNVAALGSNAFGGFNTISTATYATCLGVGNAADGNFSTVFGHGGWDCTRLGAIGLSSGTFSSAGDCQMNMQTLHAVTTSATPVVATADGNAAGAANVFNTRPYRCCNIKIRVVARNTAGGGAACWVSDNGLLQQVGSSATQTLSAMVFTQGGVSGTVTGWAVSASADTVNGGIAVLCTGAAGATVHFAVFIESIECQ